MGRRAISWRSHGKIGDCEQSSRATTHKIYPILLRRSKAFNWRQNRFEILQRIKNSREGLLTPLPPLYHGGGMNLCVRLKVKLCVKKEKTNKQTKRSLTWQRFWDELESSRLKEKVYLEVWNVLMLISDDMTGLVTLSSVKTKIAAHKKGTTLPSATFLSSDESWNNLESRSNTTSLLLVQKQQNILLELTF